MPSLGKRMSFATLKQRFKSHDSDSSGNSERARKSSVFSFSGRRSESLPPDAQVPILPYKPGEERPVGFPESMSQTDVGSSNTIPSQDERPSMHQRSMTMPIPNPLPLDKPMPPLPSPTTPIPYTAVSPESFMSAEGQAFSPIMNLAATGIISQVNAGPVSTKAERILNKIDDTIASANDPKGLVSTSMAAVKTILDSSGALKAIEAGVNAFVDDIPWIMKGLDEVAKIHPVVTVAVLAFKAVYTMEMTRRENDRRIRSLYVEMKEMIAVLIQLRDVKDPKDKGPDGQTIEARMQSLCERAASDIKDCANACDTYARKRLLVKVLKGHTWETKLVGFVGTFTQRKTDFQQALAIHTARTVDAIQSVVTGVQLTVQAIDEKMALFMKMFAAHIPSNEMDMRAKVREKGDFNTVQNNEAILRELNEYENGAHTKKGNENSMKVRGTFTIKDLKEELHEDFEAAISENFEIFERKFTLHQNQLQEQLTKSLHEVIVAVKEGPHDRIKNLELREMWKEMNWRRNVKAHLFVMTLRDHFREKGEVDSSGIEALEDWALKYIDATWLQSIMEAFDDDASGYVTIAELNRFTDSRPDSLEWSLPHWIAYWAVGWQLATQKYRDQIHEVLAKMFSMVPYLLPENRKWADYYLSKVWKFAVQITLSLEYANTVPDHLADKFTAYVEHEEQRIKKNLELIKYDIDALDTVYVVAGPGRIEKHMLPMMYLLLMRDLKLFRAAQTKVLHDDELWDAADSLLWVNDAAVYRVKDLTELFQQRKLDVDLQFKKFACGIFDYMHNTNPLWSMSRLRETGFQQQQFTQEELDADADPEPDLKEVLNYAVNEKHPFACEVFDPTGSSTNNDIQATGPVSQILGRWNGYVYTLTDFPNATMSSYDFNADSPDAQTFSSTGKDFDCGLYKLSGSCSHDEDNIIRVSFQVTYEDGSGGEYFIGKLDQDGSIIGYRSWAEDVSESKYDDMFLFRRVAPRIMRFRPSPNQLAANKSRALWDFAIQAVLYDVRRTNWSWSYFKERRMIRKRYITLNISYWTYGRSLTPAEFVEFLACRKALSEAESAFYRSIRDHLLATMPRHHELICDACQNPFGGCRYVCLDCATPELKFWNTCDSCDLSCFEKTIEWGEGRKPHVSTHDVFKLRTVLTYRDMPTLYQTALESLRQSRVRFGELTSAVQELEPEEDGTALDESVPQNSEANGKSVSEASDSEEAEEGDGSHDLEPSLPAEPVVDQEPTPAPLNAAAGPEEQTSEPSPGSPTEDHVTPVNCAVCQKTVEQPCWYCTQCPDYFLCNDCEEKTLLPCLSCHEPFVQPTWFYGGGPNDNFLCNVCTVKGVTPPDVDKSIQHTYSHPLVRCKPRVDDPVQATDPTTEDRITTLEQRTGDMGIKLDQLVEKFSSMEQTLEMVGQTMELIMAKLRLQGNGSIPPADTGLA